MPGTEDVQDAEAGAMQVFWDERARENALWYIHSQLDFLDPDEDQFWRSGADTLEENLGASGITLTGSERVLDIGCGIGRITRALAARAGQVVGVDVSPEMIERGRQALADLPNVELRLGSGRDLREFEDSSFDGCYSFIVFQHIPDPAITCTYIREMGRVLRPGGWALFQVSQHPRMHRRDYWRWRVPLRRRLAGAVGRAPRGCLEPPWLGSALRHDQLLDALRAGGLRLHAVTGEGTQFCLVCARRE